MRYIITLFAARLYPHALIPSVSSIPGRVTLIALLVFALCPAGSAASFYKDVNILQSDDHTVSLRLNISNPEKYVALHSYDTAYVPAVPVLITVPSGMKPFISNAGGSDPIQLGSLRGMTLLAGGNSFAEIAGIKTVRGRKIAIINLYPLHQNTFYRQIEVTVEFHGAAKPLAAGRAPFHDRIFDSVFRYSILNYENSKSWPLEEAGPATAKPSQNVFNLAEEWFKIRVSSGGFMKITGWDLNTAGVPLSNLESDSIHIFYGGGMPLPVRNSIPRPVMSEISVKIYDGGDSIFNLSDYLIFYAEGADRWRFPADSSPTYLDNPYTNTNCYWLAVSGDFDQAGLRMATVDGSPSGTPDTIIAQAWFQSHAGENRFLYRTNSYYIYDYYSWYWSTEPRDTFYVNLPNAVASESSFVRIRARTANVDLEVNSWTATELSSASPYFTFTTNRLTGGLNRFSLALDSNYNAPPYLDYCEISYPGNLTPSGDILDFAIDGISGVAELIVENQFSETPLIFDLSDPNHPVVIEGATLTASDIIFQTETVGVSTGRYYLGTASKYSSAFVIEEVTPANLTENVTQTDMFIIAPEQFVPYLEEYVQYREEKLNVNVSLVSLEELVNQFSFGLYDPTAIRDFLKYAYENYPSPPPSAVLLVGDGTYDLENNLKTGSRNYIPPYIHPLDSTSSDDNYVYFGDFGFLDSDTSYCDTCEDRGYDMMIARWPVRNITELNAAIEKVKSYESSGNYDAWRSTITLVADDEYTGDTYEGLTHARQTERLHKYHIPPAFRRNKIYVWEYPFDSERNKPGVNDAIVKSVNEGTLLINYVGHGNPDTWAHEHVFNRTTDIAKLNNPDRLSLIFTASCSIGFFDNPVREGMAEELFRFLGGGVIGVIAATRLVYSGENADFNRQVFDVLLGSDNLSICQSLFVGKLLRQYSSGYPQLKINDRKYAFFGDPLLRLGTPVCNINFTDCPNEFTALDTHHVSAEVVDKVTSAHIDFNGSAMISVYDSEIQKVHKGVSDAGEIVDSLVYSEAGPIIYRGATDIINGYFDFSFIAPLDVGYGGDGGKIFTYAVSPGLDAIGLADSIPVSAEITPAEDSEGPQISYTFSGRENFVSGDRIGPNEALVLTVSDPSGLNLTRSAGHGITLTVDNIVENIINLTDLFQYDAGSFVAGKISYELDGLLPGLHRFKVKAWDNANNSSVVQFDADVMRAEQIVLSDVLNYPNPMEDQTTFSFSLAAQARKVRLDIFTLSGKKILHHEENSVSADFHEFYTWDGRDADGDRVATGVYIYKVTAFSVRSDEVVESFGKVVVIN